MKSMNRSVLLGLLGILPSVTVSYAQTTVDPDPRYPVPRERAVDEQVPPGELSCRPIESWYRKVLWSGSGMGSCMWPGSEGLR